MGLLIYIVSYILELPLVLLNFLAVLYKYYKTEGFLKTMNNYFYTSAVDKDRFGNRNFRTLFNLCLIKSTSNNLFGNELETISSVLGKNQKASTLTWVGWIIVGLLWVFVAPKHWGIGHCMYYINDKV